MAMTKVFGCVHGKCMCINIQKEGNLQFQRPLKKHKNKNYINTLNC